MDLDDKKLQLRWWADKKKIPARYKGLRDACQIGVEAISWAQGRIQELLEANNRYLERARAAEALINEALTVLDIYADPTSYNDRYGDRRTADAETHEGLLAKSTADKIRAAQAQKALFRHRKGGTYEVIGIGKMQTENWCVFGGDSAPSPSVDMREVTIYRSTEDGSLWVRPVEEFNDGRFEAL